MSHRITLLTEYLIWAVKHGVAWMLLLLSAAGVGSLALGKLRFHSLVERLVFTLTLGLGLSALALFALGLAGLLSRPVIWSLTLAGAIVGLWRLIHSGKEHWGAALHPWRKSTLLGRCLIIALATVGLAYAGTLLLITQYPPLQWDAIASHLVLAREYLAEHRMVAMRGIPHSILPALNHLLFTWAMALQDEILAQMVEYTLMMLTALGLYAWGQRLAAPLLGFAAATLWLAHPIVLWLGGSGYVDIGLTCFAFMGVYAMRVFWDERDASWWLLGMALFAMAAGVKLPGLFFLAMGAGIGLWFWMRSGIDGKTLLQGAGVALIIALPWYAFITAHTGNPFWPMFPQLNRGEWAIPRGPENMNAYMSYGGTAKTFWNFLRAPIHLVTQPDRFLPDDQRVFAPVIALLPLAWIIAIWHRSTRWWSIWLLAFTAFWFYSASFMRYWLPVAPLVGLALYEGLQWILGRLTKSSIAHSIVWVAVALAGIAYGVRTIVADYQTKGRPPITPAARQAFLTRLCVGYGEIDYINRNAQPGDTVYLVNGNYLAYYSNPKCIGSSGRLPIDQNSSTLIWPREDWAVRQIEKKNVTWVALPHDGMALPETSPFEQSGGRSYELVKFGAGAYVFHHTPLPMALSLGAVEARRNQNEPCPVSASSIYEGFLDAADCDAVTGWVWDTTRTDCPINVDIYDGQTLLATVLANGIRRDLALAGKGRGNHAFTWPLAAQLKDGQRHEIRVSVSGANFTLSNATKVISCSPRR